MSDEDANLAEVKALLVRLQRFDLPPAVAQTTDRNVLAEAPRTPRRSGGSTRVKPAEHAIFHAKISATAASPAHGTPKQAGQSSGMFLYGGVAASILIVIGAIYLITGGGSPRETIAEPPRPVIAEPKEVGNSNANKALSLAEARRLMNDGDLVGARGALLQKEPAFKAEVAFMLAQSYDPNYVKALPRSNAAADRNEAERWYRRWYELAKASGLEMDNGRLQRIINAMP